MRLRNLIRGAAPELVATAIVATPATVGRASPSNVATIATIAVAGGPSAHLRLVPAVASADEIEERAAIAEYDGKLPRVLAEALARLEVCPPPPGTQPRRWQRAQAAFAALLATGAASEALAAGWTPQELCGVSATAPHDAPSKAGLIFSMWPGDRVEGVDKWGCNIAAGGRWHNWRRVPASALVVMPWELGT